MALATMRNVICFHHFVLSLSLPHPPYSFLGLCFYAFIFIFHFIYLFALFGFAQIYDNIKPPTNGMAANNVYRIRISYCIDNAASSTWPPISAQKYIYELFVYLNSINGMSGTKEQPLCRKPQCQKRKNHPNNFRSIFFCRRKCGKWLCRSASGSRTTPAQSTFCRSFHLENYISSSHETGSNIAICDRFVSEIA